MNVSDITRARNYRKENHIKSTIKNIKNDRQVIINQRNDKQLQKILYRRDFYSTSSARDLMFHTQEHQFTLPQISNILKNNNLEFLGFADVDAKKKYSKLFPSDIKNISLENWNKFEAANPDTFVGMYSFFAKKKLDN